MPVGLRVGEAVEACASRKVIGGTWWRLRARVKVTVHRHSFFGKFEEKKALDFNMLKIFSLYNVEIGRPFMWPSDDRPNHRVDSIGSNGYVASDAGVR